MSSSDNKMVAEFMKYPNFFQLDLHSVDENKLKSLLDRLVSEKQEFSEEDALQVELIRDLNLEAFINYKLGETDKAISLLLVSAEKSQNKSVNCQAMLGLIFNQELRITESQKTLKTLKTLTTDPYRMDEATAELAYAYSRLGAVYYNKVITLFKEVIKKNPHIYIWKYRLGLTYRRCLHVSVNTLVELSLNQMELFQEGRKLFLSIIDNSSKRLPLLIAKSYVELANIHFDATRYFFHDDSTKTLDEIKSLLKRAVEIAPYNHHVLCRAGIVSEGVNDYQSAKVYLEQALTIRETSTAFHHLGRIVYNKLKLMNKKTYLQNQNINKSLQNLKLSDTKGNQSSMAETARVSEEDFLYDASNVKERITQRVLTGCKNGDMFSMDLKEDVAKCLCHYEKAVEMSYGVNTKAVYDLALLYIEQPEPNLEKARRYLSKAIQQSESPHMLYKCFTLCGECYCYMSEDVHCKEEREKLINDAVEMFRKAIICWAECQMKCVQAKEFQAKETKSLLSFKELISCEPSQQNPERKKDLADLYCLLKEYGSSLEIYNSLLYDERQDLPISELIKGYIKAKLGLKEFTEILDFITVNCCCAKGNEMKEYIESVLQEIFGVCIEQEDWAMTQRTFNQLVNLKCALTNDDLRTLLMLYHEECEQSKGKVELIEKWLNKMLSPSLRVIRNDENVSPGQLIFPGMENIIQMCHIVLYVVPHQNFTDQTCTHLQTAVECSRKHDGPLVVAVSDEAQPSPQYIKYSISWNHSLSGIFLKELMDIYFGLPLRHDKMIHKLKRKFT